MAIGCDCDDGDNDEGVVEMGTMMMRMMMVMGTYVGDDDCNGYVGDNACDDGDADNGEHGDGSDMVLLLVTNNAARGKARDGDDVNDDCVDSDESGDDDESGRDYVPMVMMVTYVVGCSRLGAAWHLRTYVDSHQC